MSLSLTPFLGPPALENPRDIPNFHCGVPATRGQLLAVRRGQEREDVLPTIAVLPLPNPVSLDLAELPPRRHLPAADGAILPPSCYGLPVREEGDRVDKAAMPFEHPKGFSSRHIPDARHIVTTRRCEQLPIRGK